jgi:hypothetical protein
LLFGGFSQGAALGWYEAGPLALKAQTRLGKMADVADGSQLLKLRFRVGIAGFPS